MDRVCASHTEFTDETCMMQIPEVVRSPSGVLTCMCTLAQEPARYASPPAAALWGVLPDLTKAQRREKVCQWQVCLTLATELFKESEVSGGVHAKMLRSPLSQLSHLRWP
jgi:hypothetical protein